MIWPVAAAGFLVEAGKTAWDASTNLIPVRASQLDHDHRKTFLCHGSSTQDLEWSGLSYYLAVIELNLIWKVRYNLLICMNMTRVGEELSVRSRGLAGECTQRSGSYYCRSCGRIFDYSCFKSILLNGPLYHGMILILITMKGWIMTIYSA